MSCRVNYSLRFGANNLLIFCRIFTAKSRMSFATEKACMLAKITLIGCRDAAKIDARVQSYADVLPAYFEDSNTFDCNPLYLSSLVDCFGPATLKANCNIYAQESSDATDPGLWIDGTTENITLK